MIEKPPNVIPARLGDEKEIYDFLCILHQENGMSRMSEERVLEMIRRMIGNKEGIIGLIRGPNGLEAAIGMLMARWWYSDDWHLEELWNFVHPAHRISSHAKNLLQYGKWCAEQMKLPIIIGIISNSRVQAKIRLYRRQLPQMGAIFLYGHNQLTEGQDNGWQQQGRFTN